MLTLDSVGSTQDLKGRLSMGFHINNGEKKFVHLTFLLMCVAL